METDDSFRVGRPYKNKKRGLEHLEEQEDQKDLVLLNNY